MKPKFSITPDILSHMNACSAQGKSMHATAREVGVDRVTIKRAAERQGLAGWLAEKFPHKKEYGGGGWNKEKDSGEMRWLRPEQISVPLDIDWNSPYVRSAAMLWRAAA